MSIIKYDSDRDVLERKDVNIAYEYDLKTAEIKESISDEYISGRTLVMLQIMESNDAFYYKIICSMYTPSADCLIQIGLIDKDTTFITKIANTILESISYDLPDDENPISDR